MDSNIPMVVNIYIVFTIFFYHVLFPKKVEVHIIYCLSTFDKKEKKIINSWNINVDNLIRKYISANHSATLI